MKIDVTPGIRSTWLPFSITLFLVLALDALSKVVVSWLLGPETSRHSIEAIPSVLTIRYSRNTGVAFGLLQGNSLVVWILLALAAIGMAAVVWTLMKNQSLQLAIALGLIAGGGVANIINRLASGYVIDFVEVSQWPAFNLADAALTVGILLLAWQYLKPEQTAADVSAADVTEN